MVDNMVKPAGGTTAEEIQIIQALEQASAALNRLLEHIRCNENFYTQQFLAYRASRTNNQAVVDFVNGVIDQVSAAGVPALSEVRDRAFDVEHSFIDKQQIVVPGLRALTAEEITELGNTLDADGGEFNFESIRPSVLKDVQVPTDGIHLEAAQGQCQLADIPEPADKSIGRPRFRTYVVQPGDTLSDIAQRFDTTVDELVRLNSIEDPDLIFPGQVLFMPIDSGV
jgi:hypothetical protein